jgi:hypothetical protein
MGQSTITSQEEGPMKSDEFVRLFDYEESDEMMENSEVVFENREMRWIITPCKDGRWGAWIERLEGELAENLDDRLTEDFEDESAQFRAQWLATWKEAYDSFFSIWLKRPEQ